MMTSHPLDDASKLTYGQIRSASDIDEATGDLFRTDMFHDKDACLCDIIDVQEFSPDIPTAPERHRTMTCECSFVEFA